MRADAKPINNDAHRLSSTNWSSDGLLEGFLFPNDDHARRKCQDIFEGNGKFNDKGFEAVGLSKSGSRLAQWIQSRAVSEPCEAACTFVINVSIQKFKQHMSEKINLAHKVVDEGEF